MNSQIPNCLTGLMTSNRNAVADLLKNPSLCSETMVRRSMDRIGSQAFNIQDVQRIVGAHLAVISEAIRAGENF